MSLSAVVFDLDYTLAVPQRDRSALLSEALDAADAPQFTRREYLDAHADNLTSETRAPIFADLFETADGDADVDADPETAAAAYREAIAGALVPVTGAEALIADLRERYRVGLLTNGPVVAQRDKLETLGWTELFDATVITGDLPAGKPDERAFQAALSALGVEADRTAYVGDQVDTDIRGAKDVGLATVQVVFEGGPAPDDAADAHVERDRLREDLPDALAEL